MDERITNKTRKDNTLAAGLIQKTHQDKALTKEIQSKRKSVRSLDREIEDKSGILDELDEEISEKEETKSGLDADIATKKETIDGLDADIETKNEKLKELDEQVSNMMLAQQNIQLGEDWKENVFKSLTALLYYGDVNLKACVSAIEDYACSGRGRGRQYRSFFSGEEASGIKAFMDYFYGLTKIAAVQTGCLLVWLANEMCKVGKFSEWEKKNVAREVNDVAIGRYDGIIRKYLNKGGGMKR